MSEIPDVPPAPESIAPVSELSDVVRRALLQLADLRELEDRAHEVGARISKITPTPNPTTPPSSDNPRK